MKLGTILILTAILIAILVNASVYSVDPSERTIVVKLGQVVRYDDVPGLHFKVPFIENVHYYDSRLRTLDSEQLITTKGQKKVTIDSFVKWRINDTQKFYIALSGDEQDAREYLGDFVNSGVRDEYNQHTLSEAVSGDWSKVGENLRLAADKQARQYGIEVVDAGIERIGLTNQAVYQKMRADRTTSAKEIRAKGAEDAEKIRGDANRERDTLLGDAYRDAERIRGEGDARATAVYGHAFGKNPEFYALYRSLNAYKDSFNSKNDVMVLDPSANFFKYMKRP